ncbi:MAG: CRISPR-associated endoribonuclease Cas6 [Chlorobium sp.]|uniref:CRISPR-associated endoribonuclease Cas6 n=1 Tax=Chlorobium sp. TaxID=1095 RepID=UPI00343DB268|nr:CRISPR-associated endoribonuclease Cas6 [Chlorobium sp.]MCF8288555.1 CRISPR-associated endoribonuclease Cas6 [Chlorobium sp.]MCF8292162.1 CRISPR-associated endoribonuclease Cas6 [Chlorobium sp.]MCF8386226.1 CRISPR-associated endoribonuclease Cas6 [Chlorobium sp.]
MRLKLTLRQQRPVERIPLNHSHHLASVIYSTLSKSSSEFATVLHDKGYAAEGSRQKFKYFTFSNLQIPIRTIDSGEIVSRSRQITLYLSSPKEEFLQHLILGLFAEGSLRIHNAVFSKECIEKLPEPEWSENMTFSMLSPLAVSVYRDPSAGMNTKEYLRYDDSRLSDMLLHNLQAKYRGLFGCEPPENCIPFSVRFEEAYLKGVREKGRSVEKLITIKDYSGKETRVKAIQCPFTVTGDPELIKVGYECGFGENNPMGFGMVKVS